MHIGVTLIGALSMIAVTQSYAAEVQDYVPEARQQMMKLGKSLKHELQGAMKAGGPTKAIGVCNTKAPSIAHELSSQSGWSVGRTSLKLRNPSNKPDAWELQVLQQFEARKAGGEDPKQIDYAEIIDKDGVKTFRYMKAIPTAKVCLNCHGGSQVKAETEAKLLDLYPEDKARGFNLGDIRGAFTLQKRI